LEEACGNPSNLPTSIFSGDRVCYEVIMQVWVKLFATLRPYAPEGTAIGQPFAVQLPEASSVADLIALLHLPAQEVKVVFVGGRICSEDYLLLPEAEVGIFPPIGGG
jgi:sulfur carrier protein ThiS